MHVHSCDNECDTGSNLSHSDETVIEMAGASADDDPLQHPLVDGFSEHSDS